MGYGGVGVMECGGCSDGGGGGGTVVMRSQGGSVGGVVQRYTLMVMHKQL